MLVTPERSTDVKLVQPSNAELGCIITRAAQIPKGTLELAFMITTKLRMIKTIAGIATLTKSAVTAVGGR
jgi:hypothetical protein